MVARRFPCDPKAAAISIARPNSAGALISSVDDLSRWDAAITAGKLLRPQTWKQMFTPFKLSNGEPTHYGDGWAIRKIQGTDAIEHGGGIPGFATHALRLPGDHTFAPYRPTAMRAKPARETIAFSSAAFDVLVGKYQLAPGIVLSITHDGDKFYAQATGQGRNEIFAESQTSISFH